MMAKAEQGKVEFAGRSNWTLSPAQRGTVLLMRISHERLGGDTPFDGRTWVVLETIAI